MELPWEETEKPKKVKKKKRLSESNYCIPSPLAKLMEKVDIRTQYEASMLSMSFILAGLFISAIYMLIYVQLVNWYKVVLIINLIAGFIFLSSFLITTFQQYKSYLRAKEFQEEVKGGLK